MKKYISRIVSIIAVVFVFFVIVDENEWYLCTPRISDEKETTVFHNGKAYKKSALSQKTLDYLELSEEEKGYSSYYPPEFVEEQALTEQIPEKILSENDLADMDADGELETFRVIQENSELYRLEIIKKDGSLLWSEEAGIPHVGWNSLFLCIIEEGNYILRYRPTEYQGLAEYSYELFTVGEGKVSVIDEGSISFSLNPDSNFTEEERKELKDFREHINELLDNSIVLLSTQDGNLVYGGGSAETFYLRE